MKKKHFIILVIAVLAVLTAAFILLKGGIDGSFQIKGADKLLAQGSIPADAKLYPIVTDDIPMMVMDSSKQLTDEDIWTITHYVDLFATLDDTLGDQYAPDAIDFLTTVTLEEIEENTQEHANEYAVEGVQVLSIYVETENRVEAIYLSQMTGSSEELEQGTYDVIASIFFKRVNGNWYEDGIGHYITSETGLYTYGRDPITGQIYVEPAT